VRKPGDPVTREGQEGGLRARRKKPLVKDSFTTDRLSEGKEEGMLDARDFFPILYIPERELRARRN